MTQPFLRGLGKEGSFEQQSVTSSPLPRVVPMASCLALSVLSSCQHCAEVLQTLPACVSTGPNSTVSGQMARTLLSNCPEVAQLMGVAWNTNLGMDLNYWHAITGPLSGMSTWPYT